MILKRFYNEKLAQASYLVGCPACGESIVIDPNREIKTYIDAAKAEGVRITAVTETHIHADYLSGSRELAAATGATLYLSDEGDDDWKYAFADEPNTKRVKHGSTIRAGGVRLDVVKTTGHTPEHISFVLTDESTLDIPLGSFTGDFIFVGDVGRPDLLEKAAGIAGTMKAGAESLYASLQSFKSSYDSDLIIWPGHGAGSACGKSLSGVPMSTLGYERKANWALKAATADEFINTVLAGQPDPPAYFKEMKRMNKAGPTPLGGLKAPAHLGDATLTQFLDQKGIVLDTRSLSQAANGLIPGTINVPPGQSFINWTGALMPYGQSILLIAENAEQALIAATDMSLIGLDDIVGWVGPSAIRFFEDTRGRAFVTPQVSVRDTARANASSDTAILDVRAKSEFEEGHLPGAINIPLGRLAEQIDKVPTGPLIVHCRSGLRSAIAMSVLLKHGIKQAKNMPGGFLEYEAAGLPIER